MGEISHPDGFAPDGDAQRCDLVMGDAEELVENMKLVHEIERGWMNRVSAKVAEEILMFFENSDRKSGAG